MRTEKQIPVEVIDVKKFWGLVNIRTTNECWEWNGGRTEKNYGFICLPTSSVGRSRRMFLSHRVAWVLTHGAIPRGLFICHRCDNPPCCNPAHMFLGTHQENIKDMMNKGRSTKGRPKRMEEIVYGMSHPLAKLNEDQVREIRRLRGEGMTLQSLSKMFGVCLAKIHQIITRKSWAHVQ